MGEGNTMLYVHMLGDLSFWYEGRPFSLKCSNTSKVMQLFLLLLRAGEKGIPRAQLLEALYGSAETQDAKNAFRILVFRLRKFLEETILPEDGYIGVEKGIYRFSRRMQVEIDADVFEQKAKEAFQIEDEKERVQAIKQACAIYSGAFLPFLSEEEWAADESIRYRELYFQCIREGCRLMKESGCHEDRLNLCSRAIDLYPCEEWQMIKMDSLLSMNRYREALDVYEDTATLFFEEADMARSKQMLNRFRAMSSQIHASAGELAEIKNSIKEEEFTPGAYYCSYPSFIDSYRMISRTVERSGRSIFLMLCTITNSRGNPIERDDILCRQTENLNQAIRGSLRRGDLFTRYSSNQFLVLLMEISQEDCEITYKRICARFKELCPGQKIQLRYYVSSIAGVKATTGKLSFGKGSNRWKNRN